MAVVSLQCTCGTVKGEAIDISPKAVTRVICYCDDCQAFARYLGNENAILDAYGGTDIYQMAQGRIRFLAGADQLRCVRLSAKGMHRWYCGCCRTPIGNTRGPGAPFIGVIHNLFADENEAQAALGPVQGIIFTKFASPDAPVAIRNAGNSWLLLLKAIRRMLGWKLRGLGKPSAFFKDSKPISEPVILSEGP